MSPRAEHYLGAARYALGQAKLFRDLGRTTGARIDRHLMRGFALAWRNYRALARTSDPVSRLLTPASSS